MPRVHCCIPGCKNTRKNGKSLFKIVKPTDDWSREWRDKILKVVMKYRVLNIDFKKQLVGENVAICEDHFDDECLLHHATRTTLKPGSVPSKNFPLKSNPEAETEKYDSIKDIKYSKIAKAEDPPIFIPKAYESYEDFVKKNSSTKIHSFYIEHLSNYTLLYKGTENYVIPFIEIYVKSDLKFAIRVFAWTVPESHEIYKYSLEDITISSLINKIEQFSMCNGILFSTSMFNVVNHILQTKFDPYSTETSPIQQDVYHRSKKCLMLTKYDVCSSCIECQPVVIKTEEKKIPKNIEPAKDKTPNSTRSSKRKTKPEVLYVKFNQLSSQKKVLDLLSKKRQEKDCKNCK